jgi:hypothetical protein
MKVFPCSVAIYGSKTWAVRKEDERRMKAFDTSSLRRMLEKYATTKHTEERKGKSTFQIGAQKRRAQWAEHAAGAEEGRRATGGQVPRGWIRGPKRGKKICTWEEL